jgi:hypothetical protein
MSIRTTVANRQGRFDPSERDKPEMLYALIRGLRRTPKLLLGWKLVLPETKVIP